VVIKTGHLIQKLLGESDTHTHTHTHTPTHTHTHKHSRTHAHKCTRTHTQEYATQRRLFITKREQDKNSSMPGPRPLYVTNMLSLTSKAVSFPHGKLS